MPLYQCANPECHAVENTALGDYWQRNFDGEADQAVCSECATGTWHGKFEKRTATEAGLIYNPKSAFLEPPGGWK